MEGRWRVADGKLSLDDLAPAPWVLRELRERVGVWFGIPYTGRITGRPSHPVRLLDRDTLEHITPQGQRIVLKRRP